MSDRKLNLFLLACCIAAVLVAAAYGQEPLRDALPDALPDAKAVVIEIPVTAEIKREPVKQLTKKVWGIIGEFRPCPTCPPRPQYGWIETEVEEPTVAEAASRLAKGGLSREETKRLSDIVDEPFRAAARKGHLCPGSCGMLGCRTHPGHWVWDDEESQEETDAKTVPWGSGGGGARGFRLFGRRR